ncbi:MAG TPA: hypothetical protein VKB76_04435 [Ktedonobacterales bacterium]|nr:hypothetical protein [Ktedonobacterales bacterium]
MNPNITGIIGSLASILGIGSSLVSQGVNIHRQLHPSQQQAQVLQQQCPPPKYKLEVVLLANGQRQLVCVEQDSE